MAGDPAKLAALMRQNGYSDDDIVAKLKEVRASGLGDGHPSGRQGFPADPNAGGPIFRDEVTQDNYTPADDNVKFVRDAITSQALGGAAGKAVGGLARSVPGVATSVLGRVGAAGAEGAAFSATGGAATEAMHGGSGRQILDAALESAPAGAAFGAGAQTVGEAMGAMGRGIRNSAGGKARALLDQYGEKPPGVLSKPITDADIGAKSRESAQTLLRANDETFNREGRIPYREAIDRIEGRIPDSNGVPTEAPQANTQVVQNKFVGAGAEGELAQRRAALERLRPAPPPLPDENLTQRVLMHQGMKPTSPLPRPEGMGYDQTQPRYQQPQAVTDRAAAFQARETARPAPSSPPPSDLSPGARFVDVSPFRSKMVEVAYAPSTDPATKSFLVHQIDEIDKSFAHKSGLYLAPESWVNGKTSMLWDRANPSKLAVGAGSVQDAKLADVAAAGQAIREQGPYAEANANYRKAKQASAEFRGQLGLKGRPSADETIDERKAANFLARRGQTTTTAGIQQGDNRLAQLTAAHPELQAAVDAPAVMQAKADLQYGLPHTGGLIGRTRHGGVVGLGIDLAAHNVPAMAGRLAYGPAGAMQGAEEQLAPLVSQLVAAAQQKRESDAHAIQVIFGKIKQPKNSQGEESAPGP